MNKKHFNADNIFWGLCFIAGGGALLLSKLGYWPTLSIFSIFLTILFVWMLVKGIARTNFPEIVFSIALLACVYDEPLGITNLTPWTVLGVALLVSIGLCIIFPKQRHWYIHNHGSHNPDVIDVPDDQVIRYENSFGSTIKYINSDAFISARLETSFGEMKVYFDNTVIQNESAQVSIEVSFGYMVLYVPRTWKIVDNTTVSFGSVNMKNPNHCKQEDGSPTLYLTGDVSFAGTDIFYV